MTAPSTSLGFSLYGMRPQQPASASVHELSSVAVTTSGGDLGNPFLWLLGIAGVTIGLIGFSASAHAGKLRASIAAD